MAVRTGARIKDDRAKWDKLKKQLTHIEVKGPQSVKVGLFGKKDAEVVIYAASSEFGTETIPERSFIRATADEKKTFIKAFAIKEFADVARLKKTVDKALANIGTLVVALIRIKIRKGQFTPLAPATIARKGSKKPLIDTSRMIGALTWVKGRKSKK